MELLKYLPYICGLILLLFAAWQLIERRQKQGAPAKPEAELPTISYVQPGCEGANIPDNHVE